MKLLNLHEYEAAAKENLSPMAFDYYVGGSDDEVTLRDNVRAFDRYRLKNRVMRDISERDLSTTVLGQKLSMPVLVAPTAFHRMAHPEGEVATAKAAGEAGTAMMLSTLSTSSIEEVAAAATGPLWFQLYVYKDREETKNLVRRAEAAGYKAIVLTVDAQIWGVRERDVKNNFQLPDGLRIKNVIGAEDFPDTEGSGLAAYVTSLFDQTLSWQDLEWLVGITDLPVLVKGILNAEDAELAVQHGAAGIVVSNHGGRQLGAAPASVDVLSEIAEKVDGRVDIMMDGGVRRGTDVLKALALGAKAVAIGRPVLWGLAVDGQAGVERVLATLRNEIDLSLALCGATSPAEIDKSLIMERQLQP